MYHQVVSGKPADIHAVTLESFADQMKWLHEHGYQGVTVEELLIDRVPEPDQSEKQPIGITFDDGYLDFFTNALPVLEKYGFSATVFLVAERIGGVNDWDKTPGLANMPLMGWDQIHASVENGISFGAHTCTHPNLTTLPLPQAEFEIQQSQKILEQNLQKPVKVFAYPHSQYNEAVLKLVVEIGFEFACTYVPHYVGGIGNRKLELQRTGILITDTLEIFTHKIYAHPRLKIRKFWRDFKSQLKNLVYWK